MTITSTISQAETAKLEAAAREQLARWEMPNPTEEQVQNVILVLGNTSYREHC